MSASILCLENVKKSFNEKLVISGLDLEVKTGDVVSILGVNGAGKTTAINLMLGLEEPSFGKITLFDKKAGDISVRHFIGVTPQETEFPEYLQCKEIIALVAAHYANPLSMGKLAEKFGLEDILHQVASVLSGGQKRRLAVALAFIGQPKIVFLDEPTTGLDPESRQKIWQYIEKFIAEDGTILLTTHYLEEAERLATKVVVLEHGKITHRGTVAEIKANSALVKISFDCVNDLPVLKNSVEVNSQDSHHTISTLDSDALIRELVYANVVFKQLKITEDSLESVFIRIAKESKNDISTPVF